MSMTLYIKVWTDEKVTLMTHLGQVLCTFGNREEALRACSEWYTSQDIRLDYESVTLDEAVVG